MIGQLSQWSEGMSRGIHSVPFGLRALLFFTVLLATTRIYDVAGQNDSGMYPEFQSEDSDDGTIDDRLQLGGSSVAATIDGCTLYMGVGPRVVAVEYCDRNQIDYTAWSNPLAGMVLGLSREQGELFALTEGGRLYRLIPHATTIQTIEYLDTKMQYGRLVTSNHRAFISNGSGVLSVYELSSVSGLRHLFEYRLDNSIDRPEFGYIWARDGMMLALVKDPSTLEHFLYSLENSETAEVPDGIAVRSRTRVSEGNDTTSIRVLNSTAFVSQPSAGRILEIEIGSSGELQVLHTWDVRGGDDLLGSINDYVPTEIGFLIAWGGAKGRSVGGTIQLLIRRADELQALHSYSRNDWSPSILASNGDDVIAIDQNAVVDTIIVAGGENLELVDSLDIPNARVGDLALGEGEIVFATSSVSGLWRMNRESSALGVVASRVLPVAAMGVGFLADGRMYVLTTSALFVASEANVQKDLIRTELQSLGIAESSKLVSAQPIGNLLVLVSTSRVGRGQAYSDITVVDAVDSSALHTVGTISYERDSTDAPMSVTGADPLVVIANRYSNATILDVSDATAPLLIHQDDRVGVIGNLSSAQEMLAATREDEVIIFDIDIPNATLVPIASVRGNGILSALKLTQDRLYMAASGDGAIPAVWPPRLLAFDVTNPVRIEQIGSPVNLDGVATDIEANDAMVAVSTANTGVSIWQRDRLGQAIYVPICARSW